MSTLEYLVTGDGPAILSVHGAMGGYDQSQLLALASVQPLFKIISVSRPGYLGTPLTAGRTPEAQADLLAALLDALDIRQAAVIAVSGGGQSTLQFALRHPDRCRAIVMVSACSAPIPTPIPFRFHLMKALARIPPLVQLMSRAAASRTPPIEDPEARSLYAELQATIMHRMADRMPGTQNDIDQSRAPFSYPVERIQAPLLVIHGTEDEAVPFEQASNLAARVPGAELLRIDGGKHISLFTHRALVRPRVTAFLEQHLK